MILYGAGGHAKAVYDCILSEGKTVQGVFDDNPLVNYFMGIRIISPYSVNHNIKNKLIISIGSNKKRNELAKKIKHEFGKAIHQTAYITKRSIVNDGVMILAGSIIQTDAIIGSHTIINTGAIVEHDCIIGDFAHIGPRAVICGDVKIGQGTFIGANATILPGVTIGKWATVGAGAVVLNDVSNGSNIAGNPAKIINS